MKPLCSTAHFVSGKWCFVVDLKTESVDNILDLSFIITDLYWVTDMASIQRLSMRSPVHSHGHELRETKMLTDYRWRDEDYQISYSF